MKDRFPVNFHKRAIDKLRDHYTKPLTETLGGFYIITCYLAKELGKKKPISS